MRGGRCEEAVPFNKGINRSVVGAYSLPRDKNPRSLWALWQRLGAWTAVLFELFVLEDVLPHLPEGSVLVLDNAHIHQRSKLQRRRGANRALVVVFAPVLARLQSNRTRMELAQNQSPRTGAAHRRAKKKRHSPRPEPAASSKCPRMVQKVRRTLIGNAVNGRASKIRGEKSQL